MNSIGKRKQWEMKGWKTVFSVRNKGLFVHKPGEFKLKNRADPVNLLGNLKIKQGEMEDWNSIFSS